eukprot:sb/3479728/
MGPRRISSVHMASIDPRASMLNPPERTSGKGRFAICIVGSPSHITTVSNVIPSPSGPKKGSHLKAMVTAPTQIIIEGADPFSKPRKKSVSKKQEKKLKRSETKKELSTGRDSNGGTHQQLEACVEEVGNEDHNRTPHPPIEVRHFSITPSYLMFKNRFIVSRRGGRSPNRRVVKPGPRGKTSYQVWKAGLMEGHHFGSRYQEEVVVSSEEESSSGDELSEYFRNMIQSGLNHGTTLNQYYESSSEEGELSLEEEELDSEEEEFGSEEGLEELSLEEEELGELSLPIISDDDSGYIMVTNVSPTSLPPSPVFTTLPTTTLSQCYDDSDDTLDEDLLFPYFYERTKIVERTKGSGKFYSTNESDVIVKKVETAKKPFPYFVHRKKWASAMSKAAPKREKKTKGAALKTAKKWANKGRDTVNMTGEQDLKQ